MENFESISPSRILYENRTVFLVGEIGMECETTIVQLLLALNALGKEPITMYIDSPGGSVSAGLAIYDTMQFILAPVHTVCLGTAASMAAWLLAGGQPGHRVATENSTIMIHQGRTVMGGKFSDMQVSMEQFARIEKKMHLLLARHTGKCVTDIAEAVKADRWMTPEEAKDFGIIDEVVPPAKLGSKCENKKAMGPENTR